MDADNEGRLIGGRYLLADRLGRGGMGAVWRARDQVLGREVAVKEMLPQPGADDAERARLRERAAREARAAARLSHPSVVRVYDVVEEDDRPWIVMELVKSRSLAEVIRADGPMAADRVAEIGIAMVDALRTAHAAGILHRDVKPGNVLIMDNGRAVLSDFGIAVVEGDSSVTQSGVVLGAPAYIPPERARGLVPTAASDLWSLGATLYAAVDGKAPFERSTPVATLTAIVSEDPAPAKHAGALDPVLRALLDREPDRRPDTAEAEAMLREALREIRIENTATRAIPLPAPVPTPVPTDIPASSPAAHGSDAQEVSRGDAEIALPPVAPPISPKPAREPRSLPRLPLPALLAALLVFGVAVGLILFLVLPGDHDKKSSAGGDTASDSTPTPSPPKQDAQNPPASLTPPPATVPPAAGAPAPESVPATTPPPSAPPTTTPETAPATATTPADNPAPPATGELPAGWTAYRGTTTGYTIGLPPGWHQAKVDGTQEFFQSADGSMRFNVDTAEGPQKDPVADWQNQEGPSRGNFPGYARVVIEKADYRDFDAAVWEFTYGSSGKPKHHVLNLGFTASANRGYALYMDTLDSVWADPATQELLANFKASFRP
ncbi:serine/threonine-protein kinase [Streptomyces sp. SID3343]|uniref:protein kinase domain-containing protein n=1 Tax=Streptomyces sp. SID3343 TaxID=2690260 RepID=UPI00136EC815|nr:protein kinase [Streptomyces sp. SID3343]